MQKEQIIPIYQEPVIRDGDLPPLPTWNLDFMQECRQGIKVSKGPLTIQKVHSSFGILFDCAHDNGELDKIPQLINWKLGLQQAILIQQLNENRRFDITPAPNTFKNPCPECKATGELYLIGKVRLVGDVCPTCKGKKYLKEVVCRQCKGTKRIDIEEKDLKVHASCPSCNGEGVKKNVRCFDCVGVGYQNRIVLAPNIISRTVCKSCHGAGILPPKKDDSLHNTVLSAEACQMLTQQ
jgi:hypothetical protein